MFFPPKRDYTAGYKRWPLRKLSSEAAFTLVEIMIVVAIIALLAALAIPNLLRARQNANEVAALRSLRLASTACESFRAAQTPGTYPNSLADLAAAVPQYIDSVLASGTKQGYNFAYTLVNPNQFTCVASPIAASGTRTFFIDESGVIRIDNAAGNPID